jgi:hypothetical protein
MAKFRYNTSKHRATGVTPYRTIFGVDVFEFDAGIGLQLRLDEEPEDLAERLGKTQKDLLSAGSRSRTQAARYYDRAVEEVSFGLGDRVPVYHPPGDVEVGRKLRVPWIGPYTISERHFPVSYTLVSEVGGKEARTHVNRLKKVDSKTLEESAAPEDGFWPASRRLLRGILGTRVADDGTVQYQVKHAGRTAIYGRTKDHSQTWLRRCSRCTESRSAHTFPQRPEEA